MARLIAEALKGSRSRWAAKSTQGSNQSTTQCPAYRVVQIFDVPIALGGVSEPVLTEIHLGPERAEDEQFVPARCLEIEHLVNGGLNDEVTSMEQASQSDQLRRLAHARLPEEEHARPV